MRSSRRRTEKIGDGKVWITDVHLVASALAARRRRSLRMDRPRRRGRSSLWNLLTAGTARPDLPARRRAPDATDLIDAWLAGVFASVFRVAPGSAWLPPVGTVPSLTPSDLDLRCCTSRLDVSEAQSLWYPIWGHG
jgi:hypothetical protein